MTESDRASADERDGKTFDRFRPCARGGVFNRGYVQRRVRVYRRRRHSRVCVVSPDKQRVRSCYPPHQPSRMFAGGGRVECGRVPRTVAGVCITAKHRRCLLVVISSIIPPDIIPDIINIIPRTTSTRPNTCSEYVFTGVVDTVVCVL